MHSNYEFLPTDFDSLFFDLNTFDIFRNKSINNLFLNTWKDILKKAELETKNKFSLNYYKNIEHFPIPLKFNNIIIGLSAINIDETERIIYKQQERPIPINIEFFTENKQFFKYDIPPYTKNCTIIYNHYPINKQISPMPILILNTKYSNHLLTIDGNHRISYSKNIGSKQTINSYLLNEHFFDQENFFMDKYSFLIFTFWKEIHVFLDISNKKHIFSKTKSYNKRNILKYSYLANKIVF